MTAKRELSPVAKPLWEVLRRADEPLTINELAERSGAKRIPVDQRIRRYFKAGYVIRSGERPPFRYRIAKDAPSDVPRVSKDGQRRPSTTPRQRMWSSMRMLGEFRIPELMLVARVSRSMAYTYVSELARAGYVATTANRDPNRGTLARFRLARRSGPRPPVCRKPKGGRSFIFDPNTDAEIEITATKGDA